MRVCRAARLSVLLLLPCALPVQAQWRTALGLQLGETYNDNPRHVQSEGRGNWATEVSPWVTARGTSARAAASADLRLQNWINSSQSDRSSLVGSATGRLEMLDDFLFLNGGLSHNRQRVSQFAAEDAPYAAPANSTEVTRSWLSPTLAWRMGSTATGRVVYRFDNVDAQDARLSGQTNAAELSLQDGAAFGRIGWGFSARHTDTTARSTQATSSDSYSARLSYAVSSELSTSVSGGQEFNDYEGGRSRKFWNWGLGLDWAPTDRTRFAAQTTRRFFGQGYSWTVSHQMRRSAIDFSFVRDVSSISNSGTGSFGSLAAIKSTYPTEFAAALAAVQAQPDAPTDPLQQELLAAYLLQLAGLPVVLPSSGNVLTTQNAIDRRMRLAWSTNGVRNGLTAGAFLSDRRATNQTSLPASSGVQDDLIVHSRVKQRGLDLAWRHSLSALTTSSLRYGYVASDGFNGDGLRTRSRRTHTIGLSLSSTLGARTRGQLAYTHARSTRGAKYRENVISASLNHEF